MDIQQWFIYKGGDFVTEQQQGFYLLLCLTGRTEEAIAYREKCERKEEEKSEDR